MIGQHLQIACDFIPQGQGPVSVFPQSKIKFLEWTLKFAGIDHNFPKLKKATEHLLDACDSSQFATTLMPFLK